MQTLLALLPIQQTAPPSWYSAAQSGAQNQNLITSDQSLGTFLSKPGFDYDRGEESTPASGQEKESPDAKADQPNKSSPDPVNQFLENDPASGLREDISADSQADKPNKSGSDHPVTQAVVVKDPQDTMNTCDFNSFDFKRGEPLDPPPSACFASMDDVVRFCQTWAKWRGYAVSKSNSHPGKNIYIKCDRSGHFRGSVINKSGRKTTSSKINCPFHLKASIPTSKKVANKVWTLEVLNGTHNHEPSEGASSHSAHKQLIPEQ
ncbi:hypothetical protein PTTG_29942, partial [Puccinia triticina 1-1 BBBD Race 1]